MLTVIKRNSLIMIDLYIPVSVLYLSKTASYKSNFLSKIFPIEMIMETNMEKNVRRILVDLQDEHWGYFPAPITTNLEQKQYIGIEFASFKVSAFTS